LLLSARRRDRRAPLPGLLLKALSAHIRPGLIAPPASPILATLEMTRKCNLSCSDCATHDSGSSPSRAGELDEVIREIAAAGVLGVGFTGGEPLLLPHLEEVAQKAAGAGLITHLNTNATLIDAARARQIMESGFFSINISLDGMRASTHDALREEGSHQAALAGASHLVRVRERIGAGTRLRFVMRLAETNAIEALSLIDLAREVGVDGCSYLPLMNQNRPDLRRPSPGAAAAALELAKRRNGMPIDNSLRYLRGMARFFQGAAMPGRCSALHTSLLVSHDLKLYPCVPTSASGRGGVPFESGALMRTFRSGALRRSIDASICAGCWWNCHRELDLALGVI
jgi:MoaA/NifB/PqqE/SkfB family radical SAM enzyme